MAATYKYVIQDASTNEYLTSTDTWSSNIALAQTYTYHFEAKEKIDTLGNGYYVLRYIGIVA